MATLTGRVGYSNQTTTGREIFSTDGIEIRPGKIIVLGGSSSTIELPDRDSRVVIGGKVEGELWGSGEGEPGAAGQTGALRVRGGAVFTNTVKVLGNIECAGLVFTDGAMGDYPLAVSKIVDINNGGNVWEWQNISPTRPPTAKIFTTYPLRAEAGFVALADTNLENTSIVTLTTSGTLTANGSIVLNNNIVVNGASASAPYKITLGNASNSSVNAIMLETITSSTGTTLQSNSALGPVQFKGGNTASSVSIQGGNVRAGSRFCSDGSEDATSSTTGCLQLRNGGAYINKTCYIDGSGVTAATTTTTGALQVRAGGAGITGNVYVSGFVSVGSTMPLLITRTQLGTTGVFYTKTAAGLVILEGSHVTGATTYVINPSNALPTTARPPNEIPTTQVMGGPNGYCHMWVRTTGLLEITFISGGTTVYVGACFYAP